MPYGESKDIDGKVISPEGEWDDRYETYHVPLSENRDNIDDEYYNSVIEGCRNDPIEHKRMILGEWIDRPSGDAIFKDSYHSIHVWGDVDKRITPSTKFPITIGYDIGSSTNHSISFMQPIPVRDKGIVWIIFDEIVYINRKLQYIQIVRELMRRMDKWNRIMNFKFRFVHISDSSAFNQFRAVNGSYDCLEFEKHSKQVCKSFEGLSPIKMKGAPKFPGSKSARVRLTTSLLQQERLIVSYACTRHKSMFMNLQSEKAKKGVYDPNLGLTPKRSQYLHTFDSMSYPLLESEIGGISTSSDSESKSELIDIGVGFG